MPSEISKYRELLNKALDELIVTDANGDLLGGFEKAVALIIEATLACQERGGESIYIGNGGSVAICNHAALDWSNMAGFRTRLFFGDAHLTCRTNDYGYENVYSKPIKTFATNNDLLIAISSSGQSANILNGVKAARAVGMPVITLSGFADDNPIRASGDVNIYVPVDHYGLTETEIGRAHV